MSIYAEKWYKVGGSGKMFRGKYTHNLDGKGRIALPAPIRKIFDKEKKLIITNAISSEQRFLDVYLLSTWEEIEKKVSGLSLVDPKVQSFQRYYLSSAMETKLDKQGRILIPADLRKYADLDKEMVCVGMLKKIELWSKKRWDHVFNEAELAFEGILKELSAVGI